MNAAFALWIGSMMAVTPLSTPSVDRSGADDPDAVLGVWLTELGDAHVEIFRCDEQYCGRIVWQSEPDPEVDRVGFIVLEGFTYDAEDEEWKDGKIIRPANGKARDAKLELEDAETLKIKVSAGFRGRTLEWTRVPDGSS